MKDHEYMAAMKEGQDVNPESTVFSSAQPLLVERSPIREKHCVGRR